MLSSARNKRNYPDRHNHTPMVLSGIDFKYPCTEKLAKELHSQYPVLVCVIFGHASQPTRGLLSVCSEISQALVYNTR